MGKSLAKKTVKRAWRPSLSLAIIACLMMVAADVSLGQSTVPTEGKRTTDAPVPKADPPKTPTGPSKKAGTSDPVAQPELSLFQLAALHAEKKLIEADLRSMPESHPDRALAMDELCEVLTILGDYKNVVTYREQRYRAVVKEFGDTGYRTQDAKNLLDDAKKIAAMDGETLRKWRRLNEIYDQIDQHLSSQNYLDAITLGQSWSEGVQEIWGRQHMETAWALGDLAEWHELNQDRKKAERYALESLNIKQHVLGPTHPSVAAASWGLANFYSKNLQYAKAEPLLLQSIQINEQLHGKNSLVYANALNDLATNYYRAGNYERAATLHVRVKRIREKFLGKNHRDYVKSLVNLTAIYVAMKDYVRAKEVGSEVEKIQASVLQPSDPIYALSMNNLAGLYLDLADYDRAEEMHKKALELRESAFGRNNAMYVESLSNLADFYRNIGNLDQAEQYCLEANAIRDKHVDALHPTRATGLVQLGMILQSSGKFQKAESSFLEAKQIFEKEFGRGFGGYSGCVRNLASLYAAMGEVDRAEATYLEYRQMVENTVGKEHVAYANSLGSLADHYESRSDVRKAIPLYLEELSVRRTVSGENHPDYAQNLNNLASLYQAIGDFLRADKLYAQALAIRKELYGASHPEYAASLNNLAGSYTDQGRNVEAERLYDEARKVFKKKLGTSHSSYAASLNNLAFLYLKTERAEPAEKLYLEAKSIWQQRFGNESGLYAAAICNLAELHLQQGRQDQALTLRLEATRIFEKTMASDDLWMAKNDSELAFIYQLMGDLPEAIKLHQKVLKTTTRHLRRSAYVLSERQQLAMTQSFRYRLDRYLSACLQRKESHQKAVSEIVNWKGAVLARQRGMRLLANNPELNTRFRELRLKAGQLAAVVNSMPKGKQTESWRQRVQLLTREKEQLETELMNSSEAFRELAREDSLPEIRKAIPKDGVLIDYLGIQHDGQLHVIASVIEADRSPRLIGLGPAGDISTLIDQWRSSYGMSPDSKRAGNALRKQLWEPLLPHIDDAKTILISPDGSLGKLPFAALPGKEPDTYLIEDHRIALIPVPQLLPAMLAKKGKQRLQRELLLMGGVVYDAPGNESQPNNVAKVVRKRPFERSEEGANWGFLKYSGPEVEAIGGLYRRLYSPSQDAIVDLRGQHATESSFRKSAPQCMYLHLATHGFFAAPKFKSALAKDQIASADRASRLAGMNEQQREVVRGHSPGQLSGLVFAGANAPPSSALEVDGSEDGIMTSDEIAFMPLGGVRLAVLSACQTGLGETAGGEGLLGVQRAFQVAGVDSTIATLWSINDPATSRMMQEFYKNFLDKEMSSLDALRNAQLWALNNPGEVPRAMRIKQPAQPKRLSPKYWAPFVLSGNFR